MNILYDHQAFTFQYFGGVSKCFCELIAQLPRQAHADISIVESNNIHLRQSGLCPNLRPVRIDAQCVDRNLHFKGINFLYRNINRYLPCLPTAENINKKCSIDKLKNGEYDVFHPTFFDDYFIPYLKGKPFVLTVHDMMAEKFFKERSHMQIVNKKKLCESASAIIAVSNKTKEDLMEMLHIPENKINIVYHGGPAREKILSQRMISERYILYVGNRDGYKNFKMFIKDFACLSHDFPWIKLVCTGKSFNKNEVDLFKKYNIFNKILCVHVDDEKLKNLYAYADFFVYPSIYEGFGMPILEAFAYGCPVILNNTSCFPEIAGEAAVYYQSSLTESNGYETMRNFLEADNSYKIEIINKGYEQLERYSWEKSASQLVNIYKSVI